MVRWTRELAVKAWHQIDALHGAGIAHGSVDQRSFTLRADGSLEVTALGTAALEPDPVGRRADRAGLLVLTALSLGVDASLDAAGEVLSLDDLAHLSPLLQPAALSPLLRADLRRQELDLADLRQRAATWCATELVPLEQLRRVTLRSLLSTAASVFAVWLFVSMLAGVDLANIADVLKGSTWSWVIVALLIGQTARLGGAVSILGASEGRLALGPTWLLQMAITFINLAVPGSAARLASVMRFYQKQGADRTDALTASALDSLGGFLVQIVILVLTLGLGLSTMTFSTAELDLSFHAGKLLAVAAIGVVIGGIVILALAKLRNWVVGFLAQAWRSLKGLRSPRRAAMLFGGNAGGEVLSAITLGCCVLAVGHSLPFVDLIAINVVVALFAGLMPVPGGIGVTEAALAGSLTLAGLPEGEALAAALLYRAVTFYLPPLWGVVALRWLTRHDYL